MLEVIKYNEEYFILIQRGGIYIFLDTIIVKLKRGLFILSEFIVTAASLLGSKRSMIKKMNLRFVLLLIISLAFLFLRTEEVSAENMSWEFLYGSHDDDEIGNPIHNNIISFENARVEEGVALKVLGAPEGSTYHWTITGADCNKITFSTTDNFYLPVETDMEKLITVTVEGLNGAEAAIYFSTLPVVYINNETGYYSVNNDYTEAVMSMQGSQKFNDSDEFYTGKIEIRLRGNSTRWREKRPFHIKLASKSDLLGMGENKRWALLANDIDHTQMRNKLVNDFSNAIGMDIYMKSENVILIFNNQYYGVYQLSELVEVGSERVAIYDWEESAEDAAKAIVEQFVMNGEIQTENADKLENDLEDAMCISYTWITSPYTFSYDINQDGVFESLTITDYIELPKEANGGALLEMNYSAFSAGANKSPIISAYCQPLFFKTPEYAITNNKFLTYIKNYVQTFEYALHSSDFIYHEKKIKYSANYIYGQQSPVDYKESDFSAPEYDGMHYSELVDLDSLVEYFLVCELTLNADSMKSSLFMYKDIDGPFYMGPAWDYDWAWGNANMFNADTWHPETWQTIDDMMKLKTEHWNMSLIRDPYFITKVYEKYRAIRGTVIEDMIKTSGTIDTYDKYIRNAAIANDEKWSYTYDQYHSEGFEKSIVNMIDFIKIRVAWLDKQFASPDTLITSLGGFKPSAELMITKVDTEVVDEFAEVTAVVRNSNIAKITLQVNGTHLYEAEVNSGSAVFQIPVTDLVSEDNHYNVIQLLAKDSKGEYIIGTMVKGDYYSPKSNYATFDTKQGYVNAEAEQILTGKEVKEDKIVWNNEDTLEVSMQQTWQLNNRIIIIAMIGVICVGLIAVIVWWIHRKGKKQNNKRG